MCMLMAQALVVLLVAWGATVAVFADAQPDLPTFQQITCKSHSECTAQLRNKTHNCSVSRFAYGECLVVDAWVSVEAINCSLVTNRNGTVVKALWVLNYLNSTVCAQDSFPTRLEPEVVEECFANDDGTYSANRCDLAAGGNSP